MAVVAHGGMGLARTLIGLWLGVDRLKIAKDGRCTACTAAYRFGGGWRVVRRRLAVVFCKVRVRDPRGGGRRGALSRRGGRR